MPALELLSAPSLHGPWKPLGPMFVTTKSAGRKISGEFVTSNYFGALAGDPDGGASRVVTQNNGGKPRRNMSMLVISGHFLTDCVWLQGRHSG